MHLWFGRQVGSIRSITERRSMPASVTRSCPHLWRAGEIMWRSLRSAARLQWCTYSVSWSDTASTVGGTTPSTKSNSGKPWAHKRKVPGLKKKNFSLAQGWYNKAQVSPRLTVAVTNIVILIIHPHQALISVWRLNGKHGIFILIIHPYQVPALVEDLENQCNHCLHAEFEMFVMTTCSNDPRYFEAHPMFPFPTGLMFVN